MSRKILGVTGALASGKTTVTDMFVAKGNHSLLDENEGIKRQVVDIFGGDILTAGRIDRKKLAAKTFSSKKDLDKLCQVLHPVIIRTIKEQVERSSEQVVVIDAPLLIEAGLHDYVDHVVVVAADEATQIKRALKRGISEEEASGIIDKQMPLSDKIEHADFVIENNEDMNTLKKGVDKIWQRISEKDKS